MTTSKLSQIGELTLLEQIRKSFEKKSKNVIVGIGDDAAVIRPKKENLLVTTDMMVEGIHFDSGFVTPYQLGFKLISVNVSDIYAMGGRPYYLLLSIAANKKTSKIFVDKLFDGVKNAIDLYKINLVGGDLSDTKMGMALTATIIGYVKKHVERSGANIGDRIYVTGSLGNSACGLEILKRIRRPVSIEKYRSMFNFQRLTRNLGLSWNIVEPLLRRHLLPEARNPKRFATHATSMIDISDGLLIDLWRLCNESKVGARIYIENIPVSSELKKAASYLGISPIKLALSGGEDYELLFTVPPEKKVKAIHIGEITKSDRVIVDRKGKEKPFLAEGYQHFG